MPTGDAIAVSQSSPSALPSHGAARLHMSRGGGGVFSPCVGFLGAYIMDIPDSIIHELLKGRTNEEITGENGLMQQLHKRLLQVALEAEMTEHLGYKKHEKAKKANARNGHFPKKIKGEFGQVDIQVPRDRNGEFEPQIVKKGQSRFDGFDRKIISLYARGMTTREIKEHLFEIYGVEASASFISTVTEKIMEDVIQWQARPLESTYPVVYMDAIWVKVRESKQIVNRAVYICLGINEDGQKDVIGMWVGEKEGASYWHNVICELRNRGVEDIYIACVDGLKGFPEAIQAVFPKTAVQLCIVHMIRNSLRFVSYKDRSQVVIDLKRVYQANTEEMALKELDAFAKNWKVQYAYIAKSWRSHWTEISTFFAYPPDIRRIIYTTNPLESVNRALRKVTKNRSIFPHNNAVLKLFYLAIINASKKWKNPVGNWRTAIRSFKILYEARSS